METSAEVERAGRYEISEGYERAMSPEIPEGKRVSHVQKRGFMSNITHLSPYYLSRGKHSDPQQGRCAMEWVSFIAGEPHSDKPRCVSPTLTRFCIASNDLLPDDERQLLRPYLARTIGTRGDGLDIWRSWLCVDWTVRTYVPAWLDLADLDSAKLLRTLPPISMGQGLEETMEVLTEARIEALRARGLPGPPPEIFGGRAYGPAARDPVRKALLDAGWEATPNAVIGNRMTRPSVWGLMWQCAWHAAWVAVADRQWVTLQPTVQKLQRSVFDLLNQMLPLEVIPLPVEREVLRRELEAIA